MKAKCLCGNVSLEVEHDKHVHACHCRMCRTWGSGATFSLIAAKPLKIDGGENIARYHSSEWAERAFCKNCGTKLEEQIYIDAKAPYYELANDTPKLTEEEFLAQFGSE